MTEQTRLKPYDPKAPCPKCGCADVNSVHYAKGEAEFLTLHYGRRSRERIQRDCQRCHYSWDEAPLS